MRTANTANPPTVPTMRARLVAEFVGTFALVFIGTGAIAVDSLTRSSIGTLSHLGISIAFGLVIGVMVYTYKEISGAQFNPAVTVALWARGVFPGREVPLYVAIQVIAAVLASGCLAALASPLGVHDFGATIPATGVPRFSVFVIEVVATFFLVTVILGVVRAGDRANPWSGFAIGSTVALCALAFGPISGASMNPARSFGPALVSSGALDSYWIYLAGPLAGGFFASVVDRFFQTDLSTA